MLWFKKFQESRFLIHSHVIHHDSIGILLENEYPILD